MKALLEKSGGLIYAAEVPEEPKQPTGWETKGGLKIDMGGDFGYTKAMEKYHKTLASAKESAVLCADQRAARKMICDKVTYFKNESGIYPIPDLEWEVMNWSKNIGTDDSGAPIIKAWQVAILKESIPCRACRIEADDEQVKQMPEHTCSKGPKQELPQVKSSLKESTPSTEQERGQIVNHLANELQDEVHSILRQKESQEELWKLALHQSGSQMDPIKFLMKHYTITRRKS